MKKFKAILIVLTSVALIVFGGQAAEAATPRTYTFSYTSTDGAARFSGSVTFYSANKWSYDVALKDLKADGYSSSGQMWEQETDGNDSYIQLNCNTGNGSTCTQTRTRTEPSTVTQIAPSVCTSTIGSTKCSQTTQYGSYIFNPFR